MAPGRAPKAPRRPRRICAVVAPWLLLAGGSAGAEPEYSILVSEELRVETDLRLLPSFDTHQSLLENVFLPVVFEPEESGGFSIPDPEKVSIYGNSWTWTRWYYNGFDITDPFHSGSAALRPPSRMLERMSLSHDETLARGRPGGIHLEHDLGDRAGGWFRASGVLPSLGGIFPPAVGIMNSISGRHPTERDRAPPEERRRFGDRLQLSLGEERDTTSGVLAYAIELDQGTRRFLDFSPSSVLEGIFEEDYLIVDGALAFRPTGDDYELHVLGEVRERGGLYTELHYDPSEAAKSTNLSLFAGVRTPQARLGLLVKSYSIDPLLRRFVRDLVDPDGEALEPFYPGGQLLASGIEAGLDLGPVYLSASEKALWFAPSDPLWTNTLTLSGTPVGRIDWSSEPSTQFLGELRLGSRCHEALADGLWLRCDLYALASHALNNEMVNSIGFFDAGAKVELRARLGEALSPFLLLAKTPVAPTPELGRRMDPGYLEGRRFLRDGTLVDTFGGRVLSVDPALVQPNIYSLAMGFDLPLGERWSFSAQGLLKLYHESFWLVFEEELGRYEGERFYRSAGEKSYRLTNYPFENDPIYLGAQLQILGYETESFLFRISFTAFNAVGRTAFGNGATANDLGVLSFTMADPNAQVNGLANLDTDRGFVTKALVGASPFEGFWALVSVRHRDGQPFSFFDYEDREGQVVMSYESNRGSPFHYERPFLGPREDFQLGVDLKLQYSHRFEQILIKAVLLVSNLLDFGNELAEVSSLDGEDAYGRSSLELQIPRAAMIAVEIEY